MDIPIDVEVICTDGPGGHSSAIVLNPVTREVTHFAVRRRVSSPTSTWCRCN